MAFFKYLAELNQKQLKVLKNVIFGEVMWDQSIFPLRTEYIFTWWNGQIYVNITSSKGVHTRHLIRRFLRRYLVLKIYPKTGQTSGTRDEGKKINISKSEGRALFTVDTLKTFYFRIESPWCIMNPTHFVTKLENQEVTVPRSPHS